MPWRLMPNDLPPWKSVYYYYTKFRRAGIWQELNGVWREKIRQKVGRKFNPLVGIANCTQPLRVETVCSLTQLVNCRTPKRDIRLAESTSAVKWRV